MVSIFNVFPLKIVNSIACQTVQSVGLINITHNREMTFETKIQNQRPSRKSYNP